MTVAKSSRSTTQKVFQSSKWSLTKVIPNVVHHFQNKINKFIQSMDTVFFNYSKDDSDKSNVELESLRLQVKQLTEKIEELTRMNKLTSSIITTSFSTFDSNQENEEIEKQGEKEKESDFAKKGMKILSLCDKINIEKERILEGNRMRKLNILPTISSSLPSLSLLTSSKSLFEDPPMIPRLHTSITSQSKNSTIKGSGLRVRFQESITEVIPKKENMILNVENQSTLQPTVMIKDFVGSTSKENIMNNNQQDTVLNSTVGFHVYDDSRRDSVNSYDGGSNVEPKKLFSSIDIKQVKLRDNQAIPSRIPVKSNVTIRSALSSRPLGQVPHNHSNNSISNINLKPYKINGPYRENNVILKGLPSDSPDHIISRAQFAIE